MAENLFLKKLEEQPSRLAAYDEVMVVLARFGEAIEAFTKNKVACEPLPGHVTNLGQEYRITLVPQGGPAREYLLLRAHVPAAGYPVHLDLYDDDLVTCDDRDALNNALTEFLGRPATRDVIETLTRSVK